MAKQTLGEWIHEAMVDGDKALGGEQDSPLTVISLVHMVGGGGVGGMPKEIHSTRLTGGRAWRADELATLMRRKAENYCQDAPGVQYFSLLAFYGADEPKAEHPFLVNVQAEAGGFFSEGPDDKGQKQQAMRHLEMSQQQVYSQQQHLNNLYARVIESQTRDRVDIMEENRNLSNLMKEMVMERAMNNHERRMSELSFERSTGERKKLMAMVPPLANTVMGREIFPQSTADSALIELIAESLETADLGTLGSVIKPELLGPLMARMQAHMAKKRAESESLALAQAASTVDGEIG